MQLLLRGRLSPMVFQPSKVVKCLLPGAMTQNWLSERQSTMVGGLAFVKADSQHLAYAWADHFAIPSLESQEARPLEGNFVGYAKGCAPVVVSQESDECHVRFLFSYTMFACIEW